MFERVQNKCQFHNCKNSTKKGRTLCGYHHRTIKKDRQRNLLGQNLPDYKLKKLTKQKNKNYYNPSLAPHDQIGFHHIYKHFSSPMDLVCVPFQGFIFPLANTRHKYIINFYSYKTQNLDALKKLKYMVIDVKLGDYESYKAALDKILKRRKTSTTKVDLYNEGILYFSYSFTEHVPKKRTIKEKVENSKPKVVILRKRLTT